MGKNNSQKGRDGVKVAASLGSKMSIGDVEEGVVSYLGVCEMEYPLSGIYVLLCNGNPGYDIRRFFRVTKKRSVPKWVSKVGEHAIYVGSSDDVVQRVYHHSIGEGAQFTQVFPPVGILEIKKKSKLNLDKQVRRPIPKKESEMVEKYSNITSHYVSMGR